DGFASMDAGPTRGQLTTRPIRFSGRQLFVNANCSNGEMQVEVLDKSGNALTGFSRDDSTSAREDRTLMPITWSKKQLASLTGRTVRFRFHLRNARLFAFWVSPDESGASHGYIAGGGPGYTSHKDTVGRAAFKP
ncbi:MAG: glycosyl hydrolase family 32, partial [Limisphaerales bacterium]